MVSVFISYFTYLCVICLGLCYFERPTIDYVSLILSSSISLLDLVVSIWAFGAIFMKKSIALAGSVIVFKWAVLILIIYILVVLLKLSGLGLLLGFTSLAVGLITWSINEHRQKDLKDN